MTLTKLPANNRWTQNNRTDVNGTLWSSFGLWLVENIGATRVYPRMMITTDNPTDFGTVAAFSHYTDTFNNNSLHWALAGKYVWGLSSSGVGYVGAFAKDSTISGGAHTGTPDGSTPNQSCQDDLSDMLVYGGNGLAGSVLIVTTRRTLFYFKGYLDGTWAKLADDTFVDSAAHMLCSYGTRVYATDQNTKVLSAAVTANTVGAMATSGANTIDLSLGGRPMSAITDILAVTDGIWILTVNGTTDGCWIHKWDGATANTASAYEIKDATGVLVGIIIGNTPYVIDNTGRLLVFNGGAFVEVPNGKLPIKLGKELKNSRASTNTRWIHPNGIDLIDGRINILINNVYDDPNTTIEENLPSGIWEFDPNVGWYHKAPLSLYLQSGGSISDYGQNRLAGVGALFAKKTGSTGATADGTMLVGAQCYTDASSTKYATWIDNTIDTIQKGGYFVIDKLTSGNIQDIWQRAQVILKKLLDSSDSVTIKFRTADPAPTEMTITWTSTTTFTTTDANIANYAAGDEVEGIQGKGSGQCNHISDISAPSAGTYTVTVDTAFTGVGTSGTAKVRLQKWKKSSVLTSQIVQDFSSVITLAPSNWLQAKVCMIFKGKDEVNALIIEHTKYK